MPLLALDILPQPRDWQARLGSWQDNTFEVAPDVHGRATLLVSPGFSLEAGQLVLLTFSGWFGGRADYVLRIRDDRNWPVHSRLFEGVEGDARLSLAFRAKKAGRYQLILEHQHHPRRSRPIITAPSIVVQAIGAGAAARGRVADLGEIAGDKGKGRYLPHWNAVQRLIHRRCRASRRFNNIVAAIEMRLGREEVLSLPQYMGLCPTGQCNALCDFCSVTINRTGIIKKQLPYRRLEEFLAPVANTIQMYGIEGNGEPTLYPNFPELVERLTQGGAQGYLITNGSRLKANEVPLLMALTTVSFSLNAATAETHRQVMKLKNFDEVSAVIRALARERGRPRAALDKVPGIYVSFVVTGDNIHEAQDFLRFVEQDLGVDVALVRPLSELGNELGAVEDMRRIVPYESDVRDMIDAVRDYMHDVPGTTEIRIAPETFRSVRPGPVGRVVMPRGFEGRLLPPRRNDWTALHSGVVAIWHLNSVRIAVPAVDGELLRSQPVPIEPERELTFKAHVAVSGGPVHLLIENDDHHVVAEAALGDSRGKALPVELQIKTGSARALSFVIAAQGRTANIEIDFERMRTPAPYVGKEFSIPPGRRWELCTPGAELDWTDNVLRLRSATGGRPYLLKSYSVPCARDTTIELPVEVDVREGSIEIGVLDEATKYLQTFHFAPGRSSSRVFFSTGSNENVQLVLSAAPEQPIEATVRWLKPRLIEHAQANEELSLRLPDAPEWEACVPGVQVERQADQISLSWQGAGSPYLLKSNKIRCGADRAVAARVAVEVETGRLCVGVLDGTGAKWVGTQELREGTHQIELGFNSLASDGVFLVFAAVDGAPAKASIALADNSALRREAGWKRVDFVARSMSAGVGASQRGESFKAASAHDAPAFAVPDLVPSDLPIEPPRQRDSRQSRAGAAEPTRPDYGPEDPEEVGAELAVLALAHKATAAGAEAEADEPALIQNAPDAPVVGSVPMAATGAGVAVDETGLKTGRQRAVKSARRRGRSSTPGGIRYYCQKPWTDLHNFTVDGRMDVCCIATGASQEQYQLGNLTRQTFQEIWNGPMMQEFRRTVNGDDKLPPCARCPMSYAYQGLWFDPYHTRMRVLAAFRKLKLTWLGNPCVRLLERIVFVGFNRETRWMS